MVRNVWMYAYVSVCTLLFSFEGVKSFWICEATKNSSSQECGGRRRDATRRAGRKMAKNVNYIVYVEFVCVTIVVVTAVDPIPKWGHDYFKLLPKLTDMDHVKEMGGRLMPVLSKIDRTFVFT